MVMTGGMVCLMFGCIGSVWVFPTPGWALTGASMIWVVFELNPANISPLNPSYKETHNGNPQLGMLGRGWTARTARTLDRKGNEW